MIQFQQDTKKNPIYMRGVPYVDLITSQRKDVVYECLIEQYAYNARIQILIYRENEERKKKKRET